MADTLHFHRSLYDLGAIENAAQAFGELATFDVSAEDQTITVAVSDVDERVADRLVDAFCNHALFETITRVRNSTGAP